MIEIRNVSLGLFCRQKVFKSRLKKISVKEISISNHHVAARGVEFFLSFFNDVFVKLGTVHDM